MSMPPLDNATARYAPKPRIDPRWTRLAWPLAALLVLLLFDLIFIPGFFSISLKDGKLYGTVINILDRAAPVLLLSIGMTLVIATGGVDLSVGAVMAIAGSVAAELAWGPGGPVAAIAAALLVALLAGAWNGFLVAVLGIQPIVATLILMVAGRGIAQLVTGGQIVPLRGNTFQFLGQGFLFLVPFSLTVFAVTLLLTAVAVRKTALGLFIEAVGGNATASRYAGVNATAVKWLVYVFSGLCAGVAGLLGAADILAADANNAGLYLELDAILAVVVGGTALTGGRFSLPGSVLGALVIQTLTMTILTMGIAPEWTLVVKALVVIVVCLLQAEGLQEKVRGMFKRTSAPPQGFAPILSQPTEPPQHAAGETPPALPTVEGTGNQLPASRT